MKMFQSTWLLPAIMTGVALSFSGCAESTTQKDVADAREELREEQKETADTIRDAREDVAEAQREAQPYTVNKPVTPEDAAEARQEVAEARQEANEEIRDQKQEEQEAALDLRTTEQEAAATKARDEFVMKTEHELADAEARINQLKSTASSAEGANKDALDRQIDTLQNQHDRAEEALGNLKSAKLAEWPVHRQSVRTAMRDLDSSMNNVR